MCKFLGLEDLSTSIEYWNKFTWRVLNGIGIWVEFCFLVYFLMRLDWWFMLTDESIEGFRIGCIEGNCYHRGTCQANKIPHHKTVRDFISTGNTWCTYWHRIFCLLYGIADPCSLCIFSYSQFPCSSFLFMFLCWRLTFQYYLLNNYCTCDDHDYMSVISHALRISFVETLEQNRLLSSMPEFSGFLPCCCKCLSYLPGI